MTNKDTISELKSKIAKFVSDRNWEQFHSPKNLSMSIAIEAAELMEHFQWLTIDQSAELMKDRNKREEIEDELADIAIFVLDFCNVFGIDFKKSILRKLDKSAKKYPISKSKGTAKKYTEL